MIRYAGPFWYNYKDKIYINNEKEKVTSYLSNYDGKINKENIHELLSKGWCLAHINGNKIIIEGYSPAISKKNIQYIAQNILSHIELPPENVIQKINFCYTNTRDKDIKEYNFKNVKEAEIDYKPPFLEVYGYYNIKNNKFSYLNVNKKQNYEDKIDKHKLLSEGYIEFDLNKSSDEIYSILIEGYNNYINEENYIDVYQTIIKHLEQFNIDSTPLNEKIDYIKLYYSDNGYSEDVINDIIVKKLDLKEDKGLKI